MKTSTKQQNLNPEFANTYLDRGNAYYNKDEYDRAIIAYGKAIEIKNDCADAYFRRGNCHLMKADAMDYNDPSQRKEIYLAIANYDDALIINSDNADAWNNRGRAYSFDIVRGIYRLSSNEIPEYVKEAINSFSEVLRLQPDNLDALLIRGEVYEREGNNDLALVDYEASLRINPENAFALKKRSIIYFKKGEYEKAAERFTKAINENLENAEAWHNRSLFWCNFEVRKSILADADFNEAIKLKLPDIDSYISIGQQYEKYYQGKKAIIVYLEGIKHFPDSAELFETTMNLLQNMSLDVDLITRKEYKELNEVAIAVINEALKRNNSEILIKEEQNG